MGTQHVVTMLPGEGTGPELYEAVQLVIDPSRVNIKSEYEDIGLDCLEKYGTLLPNTMIQDIVAHGGVDLWRV